MQYSLKKSLQLIQVEKMVIILKELNNIKKILDFFNGYKDYEDIDSEQKPIKRNIRYLRMDIDALEEQIKKLQKINKDLNSSELMLFLIQYDYIRTQIEDMLRVIQALYHKMQQLFGETLNQYLPYPVLGRRFSNNGLMMYLNNYYREMLKNFSEDLDTQLMLNWNYRTGFQYRILLNRDIKRENYQENIYNDYIDLPYWYNELPILLPAITHEVAYIALRRPIKKIKIPFEALKDNLLDFLHDTSNNFVQKVQEIIGYEEYGNDLAKVIMCDVIAYQTHKESYVYTLFHNIIGEKLSQDFLKIIYDGKQEHFKILPNEWFFSQKKDHSILRLHFMLSFIKDDPSYKNMSKILNNIMPLPALTNNDSNLQGFNKIYKYNYPNYYNSYQTVQTYLSQLLNVLLLWKEKKINALPTIENSPNFQKIWEERFQQQSDNEEEKVPHQNNFRREIHSQVSNIDFLKNIDKDESIIYLLELGKARKDLPKSIFNGDDITQMISKEIEEEGKGIDTKPNPLKLSVYGIYDWIVLKEKSSSINIIEKFEELSNKPTRKNCLKYFITKQVLMKIHQGFENEKKIEDKNLFSVIFNIEIAKKIDNDKCTNGYNNLNKAITYIETKLDSQKDYFQKADIYKSLGPKDITVIVQNASLSSIFELLELLNQQRNHEDERDEEGEILRTFTILCSEFGKNLIIDKGFSLISYLRISNNFKRDDVKKLKDKNTMLRFTEVTGVMDFRIHWKESISVQDVFDFYNNMIEKSYLTDFQTKIEKNIDLE